MISWFQTLVFKFNLMYRYTMAPAVISNLKANGFEMEQHASARNAAGHTPIDCWRASRNAVLFPASVWEVSYRRRLGDIYASMPMPLSTREAGLLLGGGCMTPLMHLRLLLTAEDLLRGWEVEWDPRQGITNGIKSFVYSLDLMLN
jgi:hypothetical protein